MDGTRPWWEKAVIYQIYPRSFMDSDGDGIGDLRGIIARLDYLNDGRGADGDSLGVDAIWLSPVYPSPMKDFGYDISDYDGIDPLFGTMADFDELLSESHRRGIRIVMDLVVNHTSDEHPWFRESRSSKDDPKRDWYIWNEGKDGKAPNNWVALFEMKSAWWPDPVTGEFYLGTFTRHQPELNWRNLEVKAAVLAMMKRWLDRGVDGFRMDVVNWYLKDEGLRSNPWRLTLNPPDVQRHLYDRNRPETHAICREMRALVDGYGDRMLVGEIYTDEPALAASYYGDGRDELHFAFNFAFLFGAWNAKRFYDRITEWERLIPASGWPNFTLSNHDQARHYTRYGKSGHADGRARVAAALLLLLRGTPFLYYGEELGMRSLRIAKKDIVDPKGKMLWPFLAGRDNARTPMQWDGSPTAGFMARTAEGSKPWLPVNGDYPDRNAQAQCKDPGSLFNFYRSLIGLRRDRSALATGGVEWLETGERDVLAWIRKPVPPEEGGSVLVALNFSDGPRSFPAGNRDLRDLTVLLGTRRKAGDRLETESDGNSRIALAGLEVLVVGA